MAEQTEQEKARERYFANEAFIIGMLQVVSGGSAIASITQMEWLLKIAPKGIVLLYLTLLVVALGAALLAATWRYFYTLWAMKAPAALSKGERERAIEHLDDATLHLQRMRRAIPISVIVLLLAYVILLAAIWYQAATVLTPLF